MTDNESDIDKQLRGHFSFNRYCPRPTSPVDDPLSARSANLFKRDVCRRVLSALQTQHDFVTVSEMVAILTVYEDFVGDYITLEQLHEVLPILEGFTQGVEAVRNIQMTNRNVYCAFTAALYWYARTLRTAFNQGRHHGCDDIKSIIGTASASWAYAMCLAHRTLPANRHREVYARQITAERNFLALHVNAYRDRDREVSRDSTDMIPLTTKEDFFDHIAGPL